MWSAIRTTKILFTVVCHRLEVAIRPRTLFKITVLKSEGFVILVEKLLAVPKRIVLNATRIHQVVQSLQ